MNHIVHAAEQLSRIRYLEVRAESPDRFDERAQERLAATMWSTGGCHSRYVADTATGPVDSGNWRGSMRGYRQRTRRLDPDDHHTTPPRSPNRPNDRIRRTGRPVGSGRVRLERNRHEHSHRRTAVQSL